MKLTVVFLTLFPCAYATVMDSKTDPAVIKLLQELQKEVKDQRQLITHLQAEVESQKIRIKILEDLVEKPDNSEDVPTRVETPEAMENNGADTLRNVTSDHNKFPRSIRGVMLGRLRPSRIVMNYEGPVAFQAHLSTDLTHIGTGQKIMFDSVQLNLGNGFHGAHGLFIAPRPGIYIFSGSLLAHTSKEFGMLFMKNGARIGGGILANSIGVGGFDQGSASVVSQLDIGDEVWIENAYPDDTSIRASEFTCFMGCLIVDL